jgi:peptide/nickel transport system permease protein
MSRRTRDARDAARRFAADPGAVVGAVVVVVLVLVALLAPVLAPFGPFEQTDELLSAPSPQHPFGTDHLGRDVLSGVIWGSQASILFGFSVAAIALAAGLLVGGFSGYFGGWVDAVLSRFLEMVAVFPNLLVLVVFSALFGPGLASLALIAGLVSWPANARITRSQARALRTEPFVLSARSAGVGELRILFRNVLPNGIAPVVANSTLLVGSAVILEAALGFLGLGDPDVISWGQILRNGQNYLTSAPWVVGASGGAIFLLVLALNLAGDGINAMLSVRGAPRRRLRSRTKGARS